MEETDLAAAKVARLLRSLAVAVLLIRRPEVEAHLLAHPQTLHDVRGHLNTLALVAQRLAMRERGEG